MIYLKKLILELEGAFSLREESGYSSYPNCSGECWDGEKAAIWREDLEREGIRVLTASGGMDNRRTDGYDREDIHPSAREEEPGRAEGTLWLTDRADLAKHHLDAGQPVLVLLHEGNRGEDFSFVKYACEDLTDLDGSYLDRIYRRYAGIPWEILTTTRCLVRETCEGDVDAFYEIYRDPCITEYMEALFEDREQELAYTRDYIRNVYEFYGFGVWTVCLRETGQVIGRAGLSYREGYEDPELGFVIGKAWQGRGLAEEVCRAILRFGEEELCSGRTIAFVQAGNKASVRLLEKLGFTARGEEVLLGRAHLLMARDRTMMWERPSLMG